MLDALKQSDEPQEIVEAAKKYAGGVKGSLAQQARRKEASKAAALASGALAIPSPPSITPNQHQPPSGPVPQSAPASAPAVDLTGSRPPSKRKRAQRDPRIHEERSRPIERTYANNLDSFHELRKYLGDEPIEISD